MENGSSPVVPSRSAGAAALADASSRWLSVRTEAVFGAGCSGRATVTSIEIREALSEPVGQICEAIRQVLEEAPPEISADLVDAGAVVVGGGALLSGIDRAITNTLGIQAVIGAEPLTAVARGTGVFLDNLDVYSSILYTDEAP